MARLLLLTLVEVKYRGQGNGKDTPRPLKWQTPPETFAEMTPREESPTGAMGVCGVKGSEEYLEKVPKRARI